jgi:hypothetical protein|tara:strand:- start:317 stop:760 length:444 start_codon:yes stop_codon:yes gene_type:complete
MKLGVEAIDGAKVLYGAIKQLEGKSTPNTLGLIGKIIRDIHHDAFPIISKESERIAQMYEESFQNIPHHKTYVVAKKIKSYKFHREHIEGGVKSISQKLINGYKNFNCPEDVLKWLKDNYFVVLRLDSEKEKINQHSKLIAIKKQII